jgi:CBS domain-containing protein
VDAVTVSPGNSISDVLAKASQTPALVVSSDGQVLGIVTPFDLL